MPFSGHRILEMTFSRKKWATIATTLILIVICGLSVVRVMNLVSVLGRNIPQGNISVSYVQAVGWALFLGVTIVVWPVPPQHRFDLLISWALRCCMTLLVMLSVEHSSERMDAYNYYIWSKLPDLDWTALTIGDGIYNVPRLIHLHNIFLPDSFHLLMVSWSMLGLVGSYAFYRAAVLILGREDRRVFYVMTASPSILIWSSLLGKDPISFLGMGIYAYGIVAWYQKSAVRFLLLSVLGIVIVTFIRTWYGPTLILPLIAFVIGRSRRGVESNPLVRFGLLIAIVLGFAVAWSSTRFSASFSSTQALLETTNSINQGYATGGSAITANSYTSIGQLVFNLPSGIFTALFRPLPGEVINVFGMIAGFENLVILVLAIVGIARFRFDDLQNPLILWAAMLILLWAAQYGLTASTNLGSLARYRLQIQPFLTGLVLFMSLRPVSVKRPNSVTAMRDESQPKVTYGREPVSPFPTGGSLGIHSTNRTPSRSR